MAQKWYFAFELTGGSAGALDAIDGAQLEDGDAAIVNRASDGRSYCYYLNATSAAAESSPNIIAPDANAGTKRWILEQLYSSGGAVLDTSDLESNGGNVVNKFQTATQPGQGSQAIPVTNPNGYLDQSWNNNPIALNKSNITSNWEIPSGYHGVSVGPLDIDADITISENSVWEVL